MIDMLKLDNAISNVAESVGRNIGNYTPSSRIMNHMAAGLICWEFNLDNEDVQYIREAWIHLSKFGHY